MALSRTEQFLSDLNREGYLVGSGQRIESHTAAILGRYRDLYSLAAVKEAQFSLDGSNGDERRRHLFLFQEMAQHFVNSETQELADQIETSMLQSKVSFDGEEIPYRMASLRLARTDDRAARLRLGEKIQATNRELAPRFAEKWRKNYRLVRDLGYANYTAMQAQTKEFDLDRVRDIARRLLDATEAEYRRGLERAARERLKVPVAEVTRHDLAYLFRGAEHDALFPTNRLMEALRLTLDGMGIDLAALPNVIVDTEPRATKSPRAFCSPVRVPDEVYLVIKPNGGHHDFEAFFHEAGHALHFGLTDATLPFEFKFLGDYSITETHAFLMEHLVKDAAWLRARLDVGAPEAFLDFCRFIEIYMVRRYATKILYETRLHAEMDPGSAGVLYREMFRANLQVEHPPENALIDLDEGLYAVSYLNAWILEAMLRSRLRDRFGRQWFARREAGSHLRSLWTRGQSDDLAGFLAACGEMELRLEPLVSLLLTPWR
ncbi:MAG: hypothetical protein HY292_15070 [Planctomycetes bacterium]|nr:hypothetical protein [Planctomycetota bacterium]